MRDSASLMKLSYLGITLVTLLFTWQDVVDKTKAKTQCTKRVVSDSLGTSRFWDRASGFCPLLARCKFN